MEIVVNEWLLEYLRPDAPKTEREAAVQFVNAMVRKCDKMVIKMSSPFVGKFRSFMKQFGWDINFKARFSKLHQLLFRNLDKTIIVDGTDLDALPDDILAKTPDDDRYLIELWYSKQNRIVVTTDTKLKDNLKDITALKIYLLEEFLQEYLA
jgi:hypothetical protein